MKKLLVGLVLALGLTCALFPVQAQQIGGAFLPSFNYDIPGAWNFSGTIPTLTGNGSVVGTTATQTLTNKTLTAATITGSTISGTISGDTKVLAANAAITSSGTLADLTGFSWTVVAGGTYQFEINLPATMTTNGGLAVAFKYTTATMTSIQVQTYASTASDNTTAVSTQSTTTTDATKFFDSKAAAYTLVTLKGSFVVNAGGTLSVQVAQNTSHLDTTTILKGAFARMYRAS